MTPNNLYDPIRVHLQPHPPCLETEDMGAGESKNGGGELSRAVGNLDLTREIWEQLDLNTINSVQVQFE